MNNVLVGLAFVLLWSSASVATKFGLKSAQPLILSDTRFFIGALLMGLWAHGVRRYRLPEKQEWKQLAIYGVLNVALYLGLFVYAIREVSPGIGTLSLAINPLIISILSAVWLGRSVRRREAGGLALGLAGVATATYPLLLNSHATCSGLLLLLASMTSYSLGTVYYAGIQWQLPRIAINAWQIFFAALALLPFAWFTFDPAQNKLDLFSIGSVLWLVLPVSIFAVQLWLRLLDKDPVDASMWLFLCPISGFLYAHFLIGEPITGHTFVGTGLVLAGLYWGQHKG
jgi:probable blue pigment (indigoidine) exporter